MEHGVYQHSAGRRSGDGEAERAHSAAHTLGARDDADSAAGESAVRARAEAAAAALLSELGGTLSVCAAAAGVPDGAADLPDLWRHEPAGDVAGDPGVCSAAPGDAVPHASADPGTAPALV